jgi:hypothetical protein
VINKKLKWIKVGGQALAQQDYGIFSENFVFFRLKKGFFRQLKFSMLKTLYRL